MTNPEGIEGTNQPFAEEELTELKSQLETEQQARADAEAKLTEINGTIGKKDSRITELEAETNALKLVVEGNTHKFSSLQESLTQAVSAYKAIILKANPSIPEELITGDTIDEINHSLEQANNLISKVRQSIEAEITTGNVPAGAPARTAPDLESLSPRGKIQYAITRQRRE